jgi:hypothetical protein
MPVTPAGITTLAPNAGKRLTGIQLLRFMRAMKSPHAFPLISQALTRACIGLTLSMGLLVLSGFAQSKESASGDARLEQLERSKWASPLPQWRALLAADMVSVEYGFGAVPKTRRVNLAFLDAQPAPSLPPGAAPPEFVLSDFKFVHPTAESAIVCYHVKAAALGFDAYATSVWAKREGQWLTVFYQATLTAPDAPGLNDYFPAKP